MYLTGNHEESIRLHQYTDISYEVCKKLGSLDKLVGYDGFLRLRIRYVKKGGGEDRRVYVFYASHGYGSSRKSGAKVNKLEDMAHMVGADIILMAHEHKRVIAPPIIKLGIKEQADELVELRQYAIMTGSFLRGYVDNATTYVEKKGYAPNDLGSIKITINPWHDTIICEV